MVIAINENGIVKEKLKYLVDIFSLLGSNCNNGKITDLELCLRENNIGLRNGDTMKIIGEAF